MKPLARAAHDWRLNGSLQLAMAGALAALAAFLHSPFALAEALATGAIFGVFMWLILYRHALHRGVGGAPAPAHATRETDRQTTRRVRKVNLVILPFMVALTFLAGGVPAGILAGNGIALLALASGIARREGEVRLHVLYEPRLRGGPSMYEELYVEPSPPT